MVSVLKKLGFEIAKQKGSHIKMQHPDGRRAIIPNHRTIKRGTLKNGILNPLSISVEELRDLLKK